MEKKKLAIKFCPLKKSARPNEKLQKISAAFFLPLLLAAFFWPILGFAILLCMFSGIFFALKNGRKWCDFFCPRGAFLEIFFTKISPQKSLPQFFYSYKFRLFFIFLLFSFLGFNIFSAWPDVQKIGFAFVKTLFATTIFSFFLAIFFRARAWCILCPVGTFAGILGGQKNPLQINFYKCANCTNCRIVCPMGLSPFHDKKKVRCKVAIVSNAKLVFSIVRLARSIFQKIVKKNFLKKIKKLKKNNF